MGNVLDDIQADLKALAREVRALRQAPSKPADDIGGLDLACSITRLAKRTVYKLTHRKAIPHLKRGGRLYFKRSELEAWIEAGRRLTIDEMAVPRTGNR